MASAKALGDLDGHLSGVAGRTENEDALPGLECDALA